MMTKRITIVALAAGVTACAQMPAPQKSADAPAAAATAQPSGPLAPLAWLEGCWRGAVNKREFREQWLPLRGDLLIGVSHTVMEGMTQDYNYLRIEPRGGALWYVSATPGQPEAAFRLADVATDKESGDKTWTFDNSRARFPQHIRYRRGSEGWLYAHVEGSVDGAERKVIYPMRRIDCETGELIPR
jgi:hypothetical protein